MKALSSDQMILLRKGKESVQADLKTLFELAERRNKLALELETKEAEVKALKEQLTNIDHNEFPELMDSHGLDSFTAGGFEFRLEPVVGVGNWSKPEQLAWLRANKHDGLIKSELVAALPRGKTDVMKKAVAVLEKLGINSAVKEYVHNATAKSWVREMIAEGRSFPKDLLGVFSANIVKVEPVTKE